MNEALTVTSLTKIYKNKRGIKNINFSIHKGDIFGFLGPNGAGKTTLMKVITGLSRPQSGQINILGHDLEQQFEDAMRKVGAIVETADSYEYMSAYANLKLASRFYEDIKDSDIDEVLEIVQLSKYKTEIVRNFSLGMKQRLALASTLLSNPEFIILDEPTNGLDIEGTVQMRNLILQLAREKEITFFISSHLVHELELICNKIAIIHDGKLIHPEIEMKDIKESYSSLENFFIEQINKAFERK